MPDAPLDSRDAAELLASGGVLLLPTDTLPGFHCRADIPAAVHRIARLKGRDAAKPLLVLAADLDQAGLVTGALDGRQAAYCRRCWPGPFSLILPAAPLLPPDVTAGTGTVAVRVPDLEPLRSLLKVVGFPLVSTSVNLDGQPPAGTLAAAVEAFGDRVDGWHDFLPDSAEAPSGAMSSALVDVTVWPVALLRKGPLDPPEVES